MFRFYMKQLLFKNYFLIFVYVHTSFKGVSVLPEVTGTCLPPETHKGKETTNDSSPSPKEIPVLRAVQPHSQTLAQSSIPFGAQGV